MSEAKNIENFQKMGNNAKNCFALCKVLEDYDISFNMFTFISIHDVTPDQHTDIYNKLSFIDETITEFAEITYLYENRSPNVEYKFRGIRITLFLTEIA